MFFEPPGMIYKQQTWKTFIEPNEKVKYSLL